MATDSNSRKRLALSIIDFLQTSLKDGTLQQEDADSIEIASNCIAECFHVDPSDQTAMKDALAGQNLLSIYGVYEKLKGKSSASTTGTNSAAEAQPSTPTLPKEGEKGGPTAESERLKGLGNVAIQKKDYPAAIEHYTSALEISPLNPIYLSNRAAAYSANQQHEFARNDAELATATDPKYTKAWSRLGLARYALGDAQGAMEAYAAGIEAEGNGGSETMKKGYETAKRKVAEDSRAAETAGDADEETARSTSPSAGGGGGMPDLGSLASMLGGGGAGGGGMPDLAGLMQNPMMRQMAQNVMSNPDMLNNIMNNPSIRNMASRYGGGGGAGSGGAEGGSAGSGGPNLSELMNDPAIAEMARSFMGGMGGAGRGSGGQ